MKSLTLFATLLGAVAASPLSVVSSRPLTDLEERSLEERTFRCPANGNLPGSNPNKPPFYISPSLLLPISAKRPNQKFPATLTPKITPNDFCTIFNLEIPAQGFLKTCTLEFLFPRLLTQTLNPYTYIGGGHFTFTGYAYGSGAVEGQTTYANPPPAGPNPPTPPAVLAPGNAYTINVGSCGPGIGGSSVTVSGALCSTDTSFEYLQSTATCPLGFFVVIS